MGCWQGSPCLALEASLTFNEDGRGRTREETGKARSIEVEEEAKALFHVTDNYLLVHFRPSRLYLSINMTDRLPPTVDVFRCFVVC